MSVITQTRDLAAICTKLAQRPYVTIDTEFLREKTYFPKLCLVQVSAPGEEAYAIDPLTESIDLGPLKKLLCEDQVVKVFHAGRQDMEIFYNQFNCIPAPIFDTQIAAMVCGYGDQIGYQKLVRDICDKDLDKSHQFTDWAYRPMTEKQLQYALDDVIYLKDIFEDLSARLEQRGRSHWLAEEMSILKAEGTYKFAPEEAWQRLKLKNTKPRTLAVAQALAAWREREAADKDIPKNWILRDDTLIDLAQRCPKKPKDLARIRNFPSKSTDNHLAQSIIKILDEHRNASRQEAPDQTRKQGLGPEDTSTFEMLKMLLRIRAAENDVAARLIASQDELKELAGQTKPDIKALKGWRREIFGEDALSLKAGKIALTLKDGNIQAQRLQEE